MVVDVVRKWEEVGREGEGVGVKRKGQNAPDSVECRTARGASRCRTNRRAARKRQTRSTSCANRRHPPQESSRIWRARPRPRTAKSKVNKIHINGSLPAVYRKGRGRVTSKNAPSVRGLARAHHTRERGAVQQRIVVPEDSEREERAVRHDQMRRRHAWLLLLSRQRVERNKGVCRVSKGRACDQYDSLGDGECARRERARERGGGGDSEGKGREGSVPELCHHRSRSQTDQDETRPLTMHKKPPKVSKRRREKRNGERGSHRHVDPRSTLSSSRDPSAISSALPSL